MTTGAHLLAGMGVGLTFEEQGCDPALQRIHFGAFGVGRLGRKRRQLGDIALDSFGKLDLDLRSGFATHDLPDVDAQLAERAGAVLSPLRRTTADPLSSECLDLIVCLSIVKHGDLALHLAHLRFKVAQLLEELPGFGSRQEGHQR